jgi:serine/threonine-protein kinase
MEEVEYEFVLGDGQGGTRAIVFPSRGFLVGAGPKCELRLDGFGLLPIHAEVLLDHRDQPWVRDLTGQGLVWVNSVATARSLIPAGTLVRLGDLELGVRHRTAKTLAETLQAPPSVARGDLLQPGTLIEGRYRVVRKLAAGGMGEVYQVEHIQLGKPMAVKVMRPEFSRDAQFVARFKREAIATTRVGQLNIVDISDFGQTEGGHFYFVMEYLDGETLARDVRRGGAMPAGRAVAVSLQVAQALASAHALGVVHRDLKPENIMLLQLPRQPDFVKVLDFGVAKMASAPGEAGHTAAGVVVGTPKYMSPEQAKGLAVDARADIYALGLILYELVTGRPTFTGATMSVLMLNQCTEAPAPLEPGPVSEVPVQLEELIFQMLQKEPEARPQTMDEVAECLASLDAKLKAGLPSRSAPRAVATPSLPRIPTTAMGGHEETQAEGRPSSLVRANGTRRALGWLWLTIGGTVTAAGLGGGLYLRASPGPEPVAKASARTPAPRSPLPLAPSEARVAAATAPVQVTPPAVTPPAVTKRVSSKPPGADVYVKGALLGRTPLDVTEQADQEVVLQLVLANHQEALTTVTFASSDSLVVELKPKPLVVPSRRASASPLDDDTVIIDRPRSP